MSKNLFNAEAEDPDWTLAEWRDFIDRMIKKHGEEAWMYVEAGHNNSQLIVTNDAPAQNCR